MNGTFPLLALETACPRAVVGIFSQDQVLSSVPVKTPRRHAEELPAAMDQALLDAGLDFADLRGVAVGCGPGSFVGVRVGMSMAKGVALSRQLPIRGISTLMALAGEAELPLGLGVAFIDARRGEIYASFFRRSQASGGIELEEIAPAQNLDPQDIESTFPKAGFWVGNAPDLLPASFLKKIGPKMGFERPGASVEGLRQATLSHMRSGAQNADLHHLLPTYIRAPDAKLPSP